MNYALLVINMLNDFVHKNGVLYFQEVENIIPFIKERINIIRQKRSQLFQDGIFFIFYVCDSHLEGDKEFDLFPPHAIRGTWGSEIVNELKPDKYNIYNEIIILKTRFSGFYRTSLDSMLAKNNISTCEVVGVRTSICIMDTVAGLAYRNINVKILLKGVADFDKDAHNYSIKRMKNIYGASII